MRRERHILNEKSKMQRSLHNMIPVLQKNDQIKPFVNVYRYVCFHLIT